MFTEGIWSLSDSVANTVSVKHMSFVSKLEGIHYRKVCTETQAHTSAAEGSGYQQHKRVKKRPYFHACSMCDYHQT